MVKAGLAVATVASVAPGRNASIVTCCDSGWLTSRRIRWPSPSSSVQYAVDGGVLEAFGRLFTHGVRLYVYPTRDVITGKVITADTLTVAPNLAHLLEHLRANGLILPLDCPPEGLRTYSSEEVRSRICSGDPSWRDLVPAPVAAAIDRHGYFGASCPAD